MNATRKNTGRKHATNGLKFSPMHPGTYAGQPATITVIFTNGRGRKLWGLRTPGGLVATEWDHPTELRAYATRRMMQVA